MWLFIGNKLKPWGQNWPGDEVRKLGAALGLGWGKEGAGFTAPALLLQGSKGDNIYQRMGSENSQWIPVTVLTS